MKENWIFFVNDLKRYSLVGAISTMFAYISYPTVNWILDSTFLSFLSSCFLNVTMSYFLQRRFVFKSSRSWRKEYMHFWLGSFFTILISGIILFLLKSIGINDVFANFISVTLSAVLNFIYQRQITFGHRLRNRQGE